eukprot:365268-Chlamydomonas_euryale.AAC.12
MQRHNLLHVDGGRLQQDLRNRVGMHNMKGVRAGGHRGHCEGSPRKAHNPPSTSAHATATEIILWSCRTRPTI